MTVPINPQYLANAITIQSLVIVFNPSWNGTDWVVDPANVEARAEVLLVDGENPTILQTKVFPYAGLPQMGKNRINNVRNYFEQRAADTFP